MNKICVFCSLSIGADIKLSEAARNLGKIPVQNGLGMVYSGTKDRLIR